MDDGRWVRCLLPRGGIFYRFLSADECLLFGEGRRSGRNIRGCGLLALLMGTHILGFTFFEFYLFISLDNLNWPH